MSNLKSAIRSVYQKGYSDLELRVRQATCNDSWGPSGSLMQEICDATHNRCIQIISRDFDTIFETLDKRLNDSGKNWRHVFKALTLIQYLLENGPDIVTVHLKQKVYVIKTLREYQFVDENGHDQGNNVRQKSREVTLLLSDDAKLKDLRANRGATRARIGYESHPSNFNDRRTNEGDDDIDLVKAIEASKQQQHIDANKKREGQEDADLQRAIELSEGEALAKRIEQRNQIERIEQGNQSNINSLNSINNQMIQMNQSQALSNNNNNNNIIDFFGSLELQQNQHQIQQQQQPSNSFGGFGFDPFALQQQEQQMQNQMFMQQQQQQQDYMRQQEQLRQEQLRRDQMRQEQMRQAQLQRQQQEQNASNRNQFSSNPHNPFNAPQKQPLPQSEPLVFDITSNPNAILDPFASLASSNYKQNSMGFNPFAASSQSEKIEGSQSKEIAVRPAQIVAIQQNISAYTNPYSSVSQEYSPRFNGVKRNASDNTSYTDFEPQSPFNLPSNQQQIIFQQQGVTRSAKEDGKASNFPYD